MSGEGRVTPPRLSTPARDLLRRLKKWDAERHGTSILAAGNVLAAAELLRRGLIELRDDGAAIAVGLKQPAPPSSRTCEDL